MAKAPQWIIGNQKRFDELNKIHEYKMSSNLTYDMRSDFGKKGISMPRASRFNYKKQNEQSSQPGPTDY
eukprot:CAMPEP_0170551190 /NCGR_PEP_ID=MMETSP0211-20121228/9219_1 /TAXON_ID=311385 /ORGANISM="Pseudokeronopsis sp., Strain OXSARD2" /LENGTH=68 /DNA_ID=CAMNT_0010858207 /DNA_START=503 /DNA_END=709 /DNA_ORIENTATION=+